MIHPSAFEFHVGHSGPTVRLDHQNGLRGENEKVPGGELTTANALQRPHPAQPDRDRSDRFDCETRGLVLPVGGVGPSLRRCN